MGSTHLSQSQKIPLLVGPCTYNLIHNGITMDRSGPEKVDNDTLNYQKKDMPVFVLHTYINSPHIYTGWPTGFF